MQTKERHLSHDYDTFDHIFTHDKFVIDWFEVFMMPFTASVEKLKAVQPKRTKQCLNGVLTTVAVVPFWMDKKIFCLWILELQE